MTAQEFILKWYFSRNHLDLPTIGIHVAWDLIPPGSRVEAYVGEEAWNKVLQSIPPWFKQPQTFKQLSESQNADYKQIIEEETGVGKIDYYRTEGLKEPYFCIFANEPGTFMVLADGNHRFLDCLHLINQEKIDFTPSIANTTLDIIYLSNFDQVLKPDLIWKENWKPL